MLRIGSLFIAAIAVAAVIPRAEARAESNEYLTVEYTQRPPRTRQFNVIAEIETKVPEASASLTFCARDNDNCYRVDFGPDSIRIVKVDMGMETTIGAAEGVGLGKPGPHTLTVKCRRLAITAALDGLVVLEAHDDAFARGRAGLVYRKPEVTSIRLRTYDCGEVYFGDDFMSDVAQQWTPQEGTWRILKGKTVTKTSNPFSYSGQRTERPAISIAEKPGSMNWDTYSASVTARDEGGAAVGLLYYVADKQNYHLFRCGSRQSQKPALELVGVRDGREKILATTPGGLIPNQFYRLRVDVDGTTARAYIDDNLVLTAADETLIGGTIGLYTDSKLGATFDDIFVRDIGYGRFEDDFTAPRTSAYMILGGQWKAQDATMTATATGPAKAITGAPRWRNYTLTCDIGPNNAQAAGLAFYYQDELNHFLYRARPDGTRELLRYYDGVCRQLATAALEPSTEPEHTTITINDGLVRLHINGKQITEAFDPGLSEGQAGLYVEKGTATFRALRIHTPPPPEPVLSMTETFKAETLMAEFAAEQRDWIPADRLDTNARKWRWHRADLFGDTRIELNMIEDQPDNTTFQLAIGARSSGLASGAHNTGYVLTVWKAGAWQLSLAREGKEVARAASVFKDGIWKLDFERDGKFIFARINRKLELSFKDDTPLAGSRAGYALVPPAPSDLQANVYCPNLVTYTFNRLANDWRTPTGTWRVMQRWSCDDSWEWFSGSARNGSATAWNKLAFSGDFSLEFCAAVQMDSTRGGSYDYARDMNATIAADGHNLTSGYSFIYGGWDNKVSCLARGTEIVARTSVPSLFSRSSSMHRDWWYHKIERTGGKLTWYLDNRKILEYDDPKPLQGTRLALWAYDVGITMPFVRIAAEKIGPAEQFSFPRDAQPKTIYDFVPNAP